MRQLQILVGEAGSGFARGASAAVGWGHQLRLVGGNGAKAHRPSGGGPLLVGAPLRSISEVQGDSLIKVRPTSSLTHADVVSEST